MADITMCSGDSCPKQETCYRKNAKPSEHWQSFFMEIPYDFDKNDCQYYWKDVKPKKNLNKGQ